MRRIINWRKAISYKIEQFGVRKITIGVNEDIVVYDLNAVLIGIERLRMLFDGVFIPLKEMSFYDSDTVEAELLNSYRNSLVQTRLPLEKQSQTR